MNRLELEKIIPSSKQTRLLYKHLKSRTYNISNKKTPSFNDHKIFVDNNPYRVWFLIKKNSMDFGNVYISYDNSIGLNCFESSTAEDIKLILNLIYTNIKPLKAKSSIRSEDYFINIATSNKTFQRKLKSIGYYEFQKSFKIKDLKS